MSDTPVSPVSDVPVASPAEIDRLPNRVIVIGLMTVLLVVVLGTVACVLMGKDPPPELTQIAMPIISGVCGFYAGQYTQKAIK